MVAGLLIPGWVKGNSSIYRQSLVPMVSIFRMMEKSRCSPHFIANVVNWASGQM